MGMIELLEQSTALFLCLSALIGLVIGSFLNVVAHRLPLMMECDWRDQCHELLGIEEAGEKQDPLSLIHPGSRCPVCGHRIRAWENIPLLSYLLLKGRCSGCAGAIALRYPIVEAATGLLSLIVAWHFGFGWQSAAALLLTWALIALSLIDYDHKLLPDSIVLPFIWIGLLLSTFETFADPHSAIIGAIAGYMSLWSVFQLFRLLTGKEGMGYGDFKLLALFGAWLGWQYLFQILMLASVVGAVVGIGLILTLGRDRNIPIPFGPYLAAAGWISLLWGAEINHAYLNWAGIG
ncbi:MAG: prepilin peptidase [Candidatus Sedimenticola endophacoides]|nr:MAG: prepilin peptidase [Candidatus Sedimenticola endophacoides]OQX33893.1 MAG: prepilin peptidase [Candidatus Sedimenticola endophacoides]OQX40750.1 MAG: prepilin peptidase [Candidatus Sedimenticola endophacoides]OQX44317.1 MAG: prepilin peptidase [Candidatus Sedimenticola endophacoides]OQX45492.1 MAG: prepilin peptidase [Candidatus Sedimenticola endophacoides]